MIATKRVKKMSERLYTITDKKTGQVVALIEASSPSQACGRLCQECYQISVTRAIDVGPHIRNGGRVITADMTDMIPTTPSLE